MPLTLITTILWVPAECGGRTKVPVVGLRPSIRFQRNPEAWSKIAWDAQIVDLKPSGTERVETVELEFSQNASPDMDYMKPGELIELLDAYRVIGVGRILEVKI